MKETSTTPYLVRAIFEWCCDNGLTPYIAVKVDETTKVPMEYVKNGEIVLNVSPDATRNLKIGNEVLQFSARFAGVSREISVPINSIGRPRKGRGTSLSSVRWRKSLNRLSTSQNPSPAPRLRARRRRAGRSTTSRVAQ